MKAAKSPRSALPDRPTGSNEERLELMIKASRMGTWEWNVLQGTLTWSPELKQMFGLKPSDSITYEQYLSLLHPEDRPKLQALVRHSMQTGEEYKSEHRVIWPNGEVHWILGLGKAILHEHKPVRLLGTCLNIDEIKRGRELERMNALLKKQRAQLVALNNAKDEFISIASHQLRTPASAVKQYVGLLLEGYVGKLDELQLKMVRAAYESNERQLSIIEDLLRVAQVDAGRITLIRRTCDIVQLLDDVIGEQSGKFERRGQKLVYAHPKSSVIASVDQRLLRMVLENLIDNASKYSPEGKPIHIILKLSTKQFTIQVKDEGVGISPKDQKRLFQKFSRLSNPLSSLVSGSGLGLYWAKKIVDLHNGTIVVKATEGKGSTFTIALPVQ